MFSSIVSIELSDPEHLGNSEAPITSGEDVPLTDVSAGAKLAGVEGEVGW